MSSLLSRLGAALIALLPACSTLSDYPDTCQTALLAFRAGQFEAAATEFAMVGGALDSDEFLAHAERGMAFHVGGQLDQAVGAWLEASKVLEGFEDRPTISGRSVTEEALSFLWNDKTLPYDGEGFEIALLHGFLAWDFLLLGNLDGSLVEVRRGYAIEQREEERYEKAYGMNRFARFVSALSYELDAGFDEAELDLRRLRDELPDNESVRYSLERALRLQGPDADAEWQRAQLVVVFEQGQMPPKITGELPYWTKRSVARVSVPKYGAPRHEAGHLRVSLDGNDRGSTEVLENVFAVARENLEDRMLWLSAKAVARSAAKTIIVDEVIEEIDDKHGDGWGFFASIVGSFINIWSERADLRSWLTLPQSIQILRIPVEPGTHTIKLELAGNGLDGAVLDLGTHEFAPGKPVFISARSLGGSLWADSYPWGRNHLANESIQL